MQQLERALDELVQLTSAATTARTSEAMRSSSRLSARPIPTAPRPCAA